MGTYGISGMGVRRRLRIQADLRDPCKFLDM
jgi:hypothetical protein